MVIEPFLLAPLMTPVDELTLAKPAEDVLPIFASLLVIDEPQKIVVDAGLASWAREVLVGALAWLLRIHRRGPAVEVEAIQAITRVVRIEESKRRGYETDPGHDLRLGRANPFGATGSALALAVASGKREASDGEQQESRDSVTHGQTLVQPIAGTALLLLGTGVIATKPLKKASRSS